jgi:hypothetical protein
VSIEIDIVTGSTVTVADAAVTIAVQAGQPGIGIPAGGTAGQVLAKASSADYDAQWVNGGTGPGAGVSTVNNRAGNVTLGPTDLLNTSAQRLIGRSTSGVGASEQITIGTGLKLSGGSLAADFTLVASATAKLNTGAGLIGGGDIKDDPSFAVDFASSGVASATKAVRADDARITPWTLSTPTVATNLPGIPAGTVLPAGETAVQILERILYPYQSVGFSNFALSGVGSVYELGQAFPTSATASWATTGPSANWTPSSGSISLTRPDGSTLTLATGIQPTALTQALSIPAITPPTSPTSANSVTIRLAASQAQGTTTPADITRQWFSRWYFGKATTSNLGSPTFDIAGTNSGALLQTTAAQGPSNQTITIPAGAGFFYLFIHNAYTLSTAPPFFGLKFGGNALAQDEVTTVQITNAFGVTATYKRYKSTFSLSDLLTIVVNPTS